MTDGADYEWRRYAARWRHLKTLDKKSAEQAARERSAGD